MSQTQCPNCGGYRVETDTKIIDRKSGDTVNGCGFLIAFLFITVVPPFLMGLFALSSLLSGDSYFSIWYILGLPLGLFMLITLLFQIRYYFKADKIELYHHKCLICGYKWSRREDEPLPPITVQPDLIIKGELKLEEEREQAAAAAHAQWMQQQQRRK